MKWIKTNTCFFLFTFTRGISAFNFNNNHIDLFKYRSFYRKRYKALKQYTNYVEDHHCIPKQWRDHNLLETLDFDVNCSNNLIIMPNKIGKKKLNLHPDTLVHQGGHAKYNIYVKENMDEISEKSTMDDKKYEFWLFLNHLKKNMKTNPDNIPWK